jgi:hypothetical protein
LANAYLPLPVLRKRLAADRLVFIFGILWFSCFSNVRTSIEVVGLLYFFSLGSVTPVPALSFEKPGIYAKKSANVFSATRKIFFIPYYRNSSRKSIIEMNCGGDLKTDGVDANAVFRPRQ